MKNNYKYILTFLLLFVLQAPSIFQLIHLLENKHGIIYLHNNKVIKKQNNKDCSVFHQHLKYIYTINQRILVLSIDSINFINIFGNVVKYHKKYKENFRLRAPPVFV